jgi:glutamate 5-kinase
MRSKLKATRMATFYGIPVIIGGHKGKHFLLKMISGEDLGTLFLPTEKREKSRRYWIAYALTPKGTILVDEGAKKALVEKHKSLLPSGIIKVTGSFRKGDAVAISAQDGGIFAKGISSMDSKVVRKIKRMKSREIKELFKEPIPDEVVHTDNLTILPSS